MIDNKKPEPNIFSDTKHLLKLVGSFKYVYIASLVISIIIAYLTNRYLPKQYEVNASIISVQNETSSVLSSNELFTGLDALQQNNNIENEINNLKSFARVSSTISKLNIETGYYTEKDKFFKEPEELYKKSPFTVNVDRSHLQPIGNKFYITLVSDSTFILSTENNDISLYNYLDNEIVTNGLPINIDTVCRFNHTIETPLFKFSVTYNKEFSSKLLDKERRFYFEFYHLDLLTKEYYKRLEAGRASSMSSILTLQYSGENIEKVITFLNTYLNAYFEESLNRKNKIARSTITFIDDQLLEISDSLSASESLLRNYRSDNQITDLSFQGQQLYESLQNIESERSELQVQERYYNYVIDYFNQNKDMSGIVAPSASSIVDPIMAQMITDLLALNSERSNIVGSQNTQSLFLGQIEKRIETQKQLIIENATNNLNTLSLSLNELNYRAEKLTNEISNLPRTELNMVSMQRNYDLNDNIYTFLLQKRSEAAIAMASNYPDFEILEPAREITAKMVSPKVLINYVIAIMFGLFFPTLFMMIREFLNDKVQSITYVERLSGKSLLGIVPNNTFKTESIIDAYPQSSIAESFRNIRSSLFYKMKPMKEQIILTTSSQPKEGKSFFSLNIARSIAAVGVKTVVIDGDLHHHALHEKFQLKNNWGLSNLMIGEAQLKDIIQQTDQQNLFFISSGPTLPNPSEIIESGVLDSFINEIKKEFEYVVIDTPPYGILADTVAMAKYANRIIVVCRNDSTKKELLSSVIAHLESHDFNNYEIVYNDQELKYSPYGKYTSYYKKY